MDDLDEQVQGVRAGEPGALERLFAVAYPELRKLARSRLHAVGGRSTLMNTTALVHESFERLLRSPALRGQDRRAFFAYAAQVMRSVIVDSVRERLALRRGGDLERLTLDTAVGDQLPTGEDEVLAVHEALDQLSSAEPRLAEVVAMRYFGGYSEQEIGEALGITARTVRRDWEKARLLLLVLLRE